MDILSTKCSICKVFHPICEFRPPATLVYRRKRHLFDVAVAAFYEEGLEEAKITIDALKTMSCTHCRGRHKLSQSKGLQARCRQTLMDIKKWAGCCVDCGTLRAIELDHLHPENKRMQLSLYQWWASNGGPEAMQTLQSAVCCVEIVTKNTHTVCAC